MPFRAKCPVCRTGVLIRPDVRTCSPSCAAEWRMWTPSQRAQAVESANAPLDVAGLVEHVKQAGLTPEIIDEETNSMPSFLDHLLKEVKDKS